MSKITDKPHLIFWISIPIIILIGMLNRNEMLNVNTYDTYFVFSITDLTMVVSSLFAIIGFGYWIMLKVNRKLSKWLNLIHIALTFGGIMFIRILAQLFREPMLEYEFNNYLTLIITLIILLMIVGQLIFLINIIYGLRTKKKSQ